VNSLVVHPEAEEDLDSAYAWYESRSTGLGSDFLETAHAAFTAIAENPLRFPVMHDDPTTPIRRARLRRFPYGIYFVWDDSSKPRR
jgi:toxin ParE1/3/4